MAQPLQQQTFHTAAAEARDLIRQGLPIGKLLAERLVAEGEDSLALAQASFTPRNRINLYNPEHFAHG